MIQRNFLVLVALAVLSGVSPDATAGSASYTFDTSPAGKLTLIGSASWISEGGNPGGNLLMTPAKADQSGTIIFDDFDNGLVVQSLTLSADVKIGDGSVAPEGGFSVSFVRRNDPVMVNQDGTGFSGVAGETDLPEEGTTTGLSIGFDASQTGSLVATNGAVDGDVRYDDIGISVRVDDQLLFQAPLRTLNGEGTNVNSLQTGPRDLTNPGSGSLLTWQPLKVELTDAGKVSVWWKGAQVITNLRTQFLPSRSRVVFSGRTGTNYQFQAVDNVQVTTTGPGKTSVDLVALDAFGLTVKLKDAGTVMVMSNTIVLKFNGKTVTPTSMAKEEQVTTIRYNTPDLLPPGAKYPVEVSYVDRLDRTNMVLQTLTVPKYLVIPPAFAVAATNVDMNKPGFRVRPHQVTVSLWNTIPWAEEQLLGLHGANLADLAGADASGYYNRASVIAFTNDLVAPNFAGDSFFSEVGLPGPTLSTLNSAALEILTFLKFPASGVYTLGINSNDGYRLTMAANNRDVAARVLGYVNGATKATITVAVPQAGIYPFRLVWLNYRTEAQIEWYSIDADGNKILINDVSTPGGIKAYRSANQPVYISSVSPSSGATSVPTSSDIVLTLTDGDLKPLDAATLVLQLNGTNLPISISKTGMVTTAISPSPSLLPGGLLNTLALTFGDTTVPPNVFTNTWTFTTVKPSLKYSVAGGKFTVTFAGVLQSADTANGTYQDLIGTNSPAIFNIGESNRFFRARGN